MTAAEDNQLGSGEDSSPSVPGRPSREDIEALAYALWEARGCPEGSAEEDWFRAEQELIASQE